jgi:hypothetical protein
MHKDTRSGTLRYLGHNGRIEWRWRLLQSCDDSGPTSICHVAVFRGNAAGLTNYKHREDRSEVCQISISISTLVYKHTNLLSLILGILCAIVTPLILLWLDR